MEFHPLANVMPMIEGEAFAELVADIRENGLREPIMMFEGKILDGRNRFKACEQIGIDPEIEHFNGGDPVAYVLSMNVHRRHLTTSQRAMIAATIANLPRGRHWKSNSANLRNNEVAQPDAAKLLNVSERSVQTAAFVRDHGTDAEKEAVVNGARSTSSVANAIRERQRYAQQREAEGERIIGPGARVTCPDGITIEAWVRQGLAAEAEGKTPEAAARDLSFPIQTYRQARDIVRLADRDDLPSRDAETVQTALTNLNETRRMRAAYEAVEPIVRRIWGQNRASETKRREQYENAIAVIAQACATGSSMEVPHLGNDLAFEIIDQLEQARRQLGTMVSTLKEIYA